jgi:UPF0271 protein
MIEDAAAAAARAVEMLEKRQVKSLSGRTIPVVADTLCVHGDQPGAVAFAKAIRRAFSELGVTVAAP